MFLWKNRVVVGIRICSSMVSPDVADSAVVTSDIVLISNSLVVGSARYVLSRGKEMFQDLQS